MVLKLEYPDDWTPELLESFKSAITEERFTNINLILQDGDDEDSDMSDLDKLKTPGLRWKGKVYPKKDGDNGKRKQEPTAGYDLDALDMQADMEIIKMKTNDCRGCQHYYNYKCYYLTTKFPEKKNGMSIYTFEKCPKPKSTIFMKDDTYKEGFFSKLKRKLKRIAWLFND